MIYILRNICYCNNLFINNNYDLKNMYTDNGLRNYCHHAMSIYYCEIRDKMYIRKNCNKFKVRNVTIY